MSPFQPSPHYAAIHAASLTLMEAMIVAAGAADRLYAKAGVHSSKSRARIEVARYLGRGGRDRPAVWLETTPKIPTLNKFSLGGFSTIDRDVRTLAILNTILRGKLCPMLMRELDLAACAIETAFAALEVCVAAQIGSPMLSFEMSSRDGDAKLDEARWGVLPFAVDAAPKPGFLAVAEGLDAVCVAIQSADPTGSAGLNNHIFKRPMRRTWPVTVRKHEVVGFLAAMPSVYAPDEATARELVDIAIATLAKTGPTIPASAGQDRFQLDSVNP